MSTNANAVYNNGYGLMFLRIAIGIRLIYGTIDNVLSWAKMQEFAGFLTSLNFPSPLASAVLSVYAQMICGILFIIGYKIRWAAVLMMINFLIASYIHLPDGIPAMTPALLIFFASVTFLLDGAGALSLDNRKQLTPSGYAK
jgi:putative oxidoreductase